MQAGDAGQEGAHLLATCSKTPWPVAVSIIPACSADTCLLHALRQTNHQPTHPRLCPPDGCVRHALWHSHGAQAAPLLPHIFSKLPTGTGSTRQVAAQRGVSRKQEVYQWGG